MKYFEKKVYRNFILLLFLVVTAFFTISLLNLKFDHDYEKFLPISSKEYINYKILKKEFGTDNDFLFIVIKPKNGIFNKTFLKNLDTTISKISKLDEVKTCLSITNLVNPEIKVFGKVSNKKFIDIEDEETFSEDSINLFNEELYKELFFSNNKKETSIYLTHRHFESKEEAGAFVQKLNKEIGKVLESEFFAVGKITAEYKYLFYLEKNFKFFIIALTIFIFISFLIIYQSITIALVSFVLIFMAMVWTIGTLTFLNYTMNILSMVIAPIILILGTSDIIHLLTKYIDELRLGKSKKAALQITFKEIGVPTFLTSFSSMVGFLTFNTFEITPLKDLGNFTALGIFYAFIIAYTLFPIILIILPKPTISKYNNYKKFWNKFLKFTFFWVFRNQKKVIFITIILVIISIIGVFKIKINTFLLEDLKKENPLKQEMKYVDDNFGGVRAFEALIFLKDSLKRITDIEVLKEIEEVEGFLKKEIGVKQPISPLTLVKKLNRAIHRGNKRFEILPENSNQISGFVQKFLKEDSVFNILSEDEKIGRITGKIGDIGSYRALKLKEKFNNFVKSQNFKYINLVWTGSADLIDTNNTNMVIGLVTSFGLAFILICLMMIYLTKSIKLGLMCILVNMFPILFIAGFMGFMEINLKLSTIIVFSSVFGLAVDNIIHIVSRFRWEKVINRSSSVIALKRTMYSTGKSIIVVGLILISGFGVMIFSDFDSVYFMGILTTVALISSIIINLTLLLIILRKVKFK